MKKLAQNIMLEVPLIEPNLEVVVGAKIEENNQKDSI